MEQLSLFQNQQIPFTIIEITSHIRDLMESDATLQDLWVQGEVSNSSRPKSGHMYFTLKDDKASLRCVMWRHQVERLAYVPQDGDFVEAHGSINVYEMGGQYQLYADLIRPAGEGQLFQEFQRLKEKLEKEGLFDPDRKRPIPLRPLCIGIVTSPTGAALRDMLNTLRRRYPLVQVVLSPAAVQGEDAPQELISALQALNTYVSPDVILLGRGGGSIVDLWAFNHEGLARAIAASKAPVISGVGHETDFTIADFVADLRAPTPTAAAELAVPDCLEMIAVIHDTRGQLSRLMYAFIDDRRWSLSEWRNRLLRRSPQHQLHMNRQRIDELSGRSVASIGYRLRLKRSQLEGLQQRLLALNPMGVLQRGFAVVTKDDGTLVSRVEHVRAGDALNIRVKDGQVDAEVKGKRGPA